MLGYLAKGKVGLKYFKVNINFSVHVWRSVAANIEKKSLKHNKAQYFNF